MNGQIDTWTTRDSFSCSSQSGDKEEKIAIPIREKLGTVSERTTRFYRYLLSTRSLGALALRRRIHRGGREVAARRLRLAATAVRWVFPLL